MGDTITFRFLLVLLLATIVGSGCDSHDNYEPPRESYEVRQWPRLMEQFSELDAHLGSLTKVDSPSFMFFGDVLEENGVSPRLVQELIELVKKNDKQSSGPSYHGLIHSARIANLAAASSKTEKCKALTQHERALIIIAAFLHDIDPHREDGTPARVWATFEWMDKDPEAHEFFVQLERENDIHLNQIKTLIKFTDFDVDEKKRLQILMDAKKMAALHFGKRHEFAETVGEALAFLDQVSMYIGSFNFAVQAVVGLANEFRRSIALTEEKKGNKIVITSPSDVAILSATPLFLKPRLHDKNISWLPKEMHDNLKDVYQSFVRVWSTRKHL